MQHADSKATVTQSPCAVSSTAINGAQQTCMLQTSAAQQPQATMLRRSTRKRKRTMTDEQYRNELKKIEAEGASSDAEDSDYVPSESSADLDYEDVEDS